MKKSPDSPKSLPNQAMGSLFSVDSIDRKILSILAANGRITINDLAERVGLSTSPCWTRVKRLEENGAIEKYVAILNHECVGLPNIVFVEITLDKHDKDVLERFGDALARTPQILEAYLVTGDFDYLIKVAVGGTEDYEKFLREVLYKIDGIRNSRTIFGLRALKRAVSVDPMELTGIRLSRSTT